MKKEVKYRPNGNIEKETPVCPECFSGVDTPKVGDFLMVRVDDAVERVEVISVLEKRKMLVRLSRYNKTLHFVVSQSSILG